MRIRQADPNTTANYSNLQRQFEHEVGSSGAASDRSRWGSRLPKALRGPGGAVPMRRPRARNRPLSFNPGKTTTDSGWAVAYDIKSASILVASRRQTWRMRPGPRVMEQG
jgi:hypothetical protein